MTKLSSFGLAELKSEGQSTAYCAGESMSSVPEPTWIVLLNKEVIAVEGPRAVLLKIKGDINVSSDQYSVLPKVRWTAWTKNRVYFPAGYDGRVWVASVPRNPCDEETAIVGGGVQ